MSHDPKTILLAGPSLLYAPVFLAKYGRLSPVFDHVQLDWEPERREAAWQNDSACSDPLLAALLEKNRDNEVIIAVCDPCRVGYLPKVGDLHQACLISGLIRRACLNYGRLHGEFGDDDDVFENVGEIIINKPEMTSFSITAELLGHMGAAPDLFYGVPIGLERTEARARTIVRRHRRQSSGLEANSASDKAVLFSSLSSPASTATGQNRSVCDLKLKGPAAAAIERYKHFLFTGLLTTEEFRCAAPCFLREIISALSFAIRVIEADQRAAAEELWRAPDLRRALERDVNFDQAVVFLERMVADKVFECWVEPAFDHDAPYCEPLGNAIETHKAATWATEDLSNNNQRASFNANKVWNLLPSRRSVRAEDYQSVDPSMFLNRPKLSIFAKFSRRVRASLAKFRCWLRAVSANFWRWLRAVAGCGSENAMGKEDNSLLSAKHLLKVPPGARQSFAFGLLALFVMSTLFLLILGWSDWALRYATPTIAEWEKKAGWQAVLYVFDPLFERHFATDDRKEAPGPSLVAATDGDLNHGANDISAYVNIKSEYFEGDRVRNQMGLVFCLIGCLLLAFLERPRRRNTRGYGLFDWLFFLAGMGLLLTGVRALSDGKTMVNTLFGWGAIFYAFARLARHPLPNPVKWWRASRQRRIGIYEFRRALHQAAWETRDSEFAYWTIDHPTVAATKVKIRARMRWHQTGWLLSMWLGGQWCGWLAGLPIRFLLSVAAGGLAAWCFFKRTWFPEPLGRKWLWLLLFLLVFWFFRWLTKAAPLTWGGKLQGLWDWVRWQWFRIPWTGSGFRNADQIQ